MSRFSQTLREHARYPSNQGPIKDAQLVGRASLSGNPPFITIYLRLAGEIVEEVGFQSQGCGVTTAACSVLTEMLEGKSLAECAAITEEQVVAALEGLPPDKRHCSHIAMKALADALGGSTP